MRLAILSDIHSNWEALQAAVDAASGKRVDRWVVLGDTVGYGANPNECYDWVRSHADVNLMGNHEKALSDAELKARFSENARCAIDWTRTQLREEFLSEMAGLPYVHTEPAASFVHASFHEPEAFHYLFQFQEAAPSFPLLSGDVGFFGHTHVPVCFYEKAQKMEPLPPGCIELKEGERYLLNPGSVGQPRDRDPRLSFGIFDSETRIFELIRVPYDNHKAADKIRKANLPAFLADRLL